MKVEEQKKLEKQEKENEELETRLKKLKEEKLDDTVLQNRIELEEQVEKLKNELKKAEALTNPTKQKHQRNKLERKEKEFRDKSGQLSNLENCLVHARATLNQLQSAEYNPDTRIQQTQQSTMETAIKQNKEWKDKSIAMALQLFEAKVAWADENNNYQKNTNELNNVYNNTIVKLEQLKNEYKHIKKEYAKMDKKRRKCLAKKK